MVFGRIASAVVMGIAAAVGSIAAAAAPIAPEQLPRGDYETYWRQIGGNWLSELTSSTIQGCLPPPSPCGAAGGRRLAGATVKHRPDGCSAPAITVQCVVQKAGMGLPGGRTAGPGGSSPTPAPSAPRRDGKIPPERLPRGDYETYWRQIGGNWLSRLGRSTIQGCAYPGPSACGAAVGGAYLAGDTVRYSPAGCSAPAITVQCVVQKAGMGLPGGRSPSP